LDIVNDFGFSKKIIVSDTTGSRNMYMSIDKASGFSRAQNLNMQLCTPDAPLSVLFDLSEPKQGNPSRWGLDIEIPVGTAIYRFLEQLNANAREEVGGRAVECFPSLKTEKMSDDQLNMCMYPVFKPAEDGGKTGRLKVKVIMPATDDELSRMSRADADRRQNETTKVFSVNEFSPPTVANPDGTFEHTPSDPSILKGGCKVMPIISTTGIWMNKSNCGISFICTSICVWKAPETTGVGIFNLGGVRPGGIKRRSRDDDEFDGGYHPYDEDINATESSID
jgi:hypothetical protein